MKEKGFLKLIGEPVGRSDGIITTPWLYRDGSLKVDNSKAAAFYSPSEVELLGDGDFQEGVNKIMQAYYKAPLSVMGGGKTKQLQDKIDRLQRGLGDPDF